MKRLALAVAAAALSVAGPALSATTNTTFAVSALVVDVCAVAALPLSFGTYNPTSGSDLDATSTVTVTCSLGTDYNVRMSAGLHGSGVADRVLLRTGGVEDVADDELSYALFRDSNYTDNWGQTDNSDTYDGVGTGLPELITVYGRIAGSDNVVAGAFADTVTVTVFY